MMNAELYARTGGKALSQDNLNTVKVINVVDESGEPVSWTGPAGPAGPQGERGPAGPAASITKAAHVDPSKGSVADVVKALIGAGLMASA
nr:MAG: hypothetical protein [Bacteriophage sp.]